MLNKNDRTAKKTRTKNELKKQENLFLYYCSYRDFNIILLVTEKSKSQKICKDKVDLNSTTNQTDSTDSYRIHHPTTTEQNAHTSQAHMEHL